jgi:hypothetical protein
MDSNSYQTFQELLANEHLLYVPCLLTIRHMRSFLVIVSVDVTPHRFILISGMRIPGASVCPPPATDP